MRPPAELGSLPDLLRVRAQQDPEMMFVCQGSRSVSYGQFDQRTDELAAGLSQLGVRPGARVAVLLPNCIEFLEAWWAILKAGGVLVPVNPAYTGPEASYVIGHAGALAVVSDARGMQVLAGERARLDRLRHLIGIQPGCGDVCLSELARPGERAPDPRRTGDDLAAILYTSGTTGRPKGAMLTHRNELVNAAQGAELLPLAHGERVGMMLPLFHANAQVVTVLIPMTIGCEVAMWERFSAGTFWSTVAELAPVSVSAVPTILATVLNTPSSPSGATSLRYVICGAAPLSAELLRSFQERFGIRILEGYGLTEGACISSINPFYGERKAGSIGLPIRGQRMEIRRSDGRAAAPGERGEIVVSGPNVMAGYLDDPDASAQTIRDGWLHTGDVGYVDEDGYFYVVDRSKDMIIRGGENIYPREIEEVLYTHAGVRECAVIGVADEIRGEEVVAVVVPAAGDSLKVEELAEHLAARLARYKLPSRYEFCDELPKTATGKISKAPLRERYGARPSAPAGSPGAGA